MRAEILGLAVKPGVYLGESAADLTENLAAFHSVIEVKILRRSGTKPTTAFFRNQIPRLSGIYRRQFFPVFSLVSAQKFFPI